MTTQALRDAGPVQADRIGSTTIVMGRARGDRGQWVSPLKWNFFGVPASGVVFFRQLRTRTPLPWRTPYCALHSASGLAGLFENLRTINTEQ
ncbi:Uncharacterised protein [Mycobacteroides abscessus]|nr:Uncharacterised protein [Mycobacteroides abscessus]CPU62755.1 Uncharacterised protein [Mycobacteroides abscessus]SKQ36820.1 Uncharacterised protein [Mycobacteroides abscessus subsp. massiliense]SKW96895.1 Uncharacterised protein [Mycobacteroides abscessus subsp. massiliense]